MGNEEIERIKKANPTDQDAEEKPHDPEQLKEWLAHYKERKLDEREAERIQEEIKKEVSKETGFQFDTSQIGPRLFPTDAELSGIAEEAQARADEARARMLKMDGPKK